jgi:hypothetical protein
MVLKVLFDGSFDGFIKRMPKNPRHKLTNQPKCISADILNKNDLLHKPQTIWNMDEKGVSMEHTPVKVVADKASRNTPGRDLKCPQSKHFVGMSILTQLVLQEH